MRLGELARRLGADLLGDPATEVHSAAPLDRAGPGQISFLANPKYRPLLPDTRASAVIVASGEKVPATCARLVTDNPYLAFARTVEFLHAPASPSPGVEDGAWVHPEARVDSGATVMAGARVDAGARIGGATVLYPGVYLGRDARVGRQCVLHANCVVREGCVLGDRVILQPGAVIGSDGYGYARDGHRHIKIRQVGIAVLEDDVEVGAGSTVDRAALGETRIGRGTKIDNLVQIAHNVEIGEDCLLVAQVGVSGSTRLGNRVVLAGQAGVVGHIAIGEGSVVGAQAGVGTDLPPGSTVSGSPAFDHPQWLRAQGLVRRLPQLKEQIRALERRVRELEALLEEAHPQRGEHDRHP